MEAQPSTSSGLPVSHQYSLANTVNIILNDSLLENQFPADSDSGEEFDATDSNPTRSLLLLASYTGSFQLC